MKSKIFGQNVADKYATAVTKNLNLGCNSILCSADLFPYRWSTLSGLVCYKCVESDIFKKIKNLQLLDKIIIYISLLFQGFNLVIDCLKINSPSFAWFLM